MTIAAKPCCREIRTDDARFEAQGKGVEIRFATNSQNPDQEALIVGSGKLISRAIENIVRNALRFSRQGDTITMTFTR